MTRRTPWAAPPSRSLRSKDMPEPAARKRRGADEGDAPPAPPTLTGDDERDVRRYFEERGWEPLAFQVEAALAFLAGESGLVNAPTGAGKTLAVWLGPLVEGARSPRAGARILWITPLRALASDTAASLRRAATDFGLPWRVELRTSDVSPTERRKQLVHPPEALVTTPESLWSLLTYEETRAGFEGLDAVIVDEWHELLGTKRGTQLELCLARLRRWRPGLRTWGVSASIGNLGEAMDSLLGARPEGPAEGSPGARPRGRLVRSSQDKTVLIESVRPPDVERFSWAGHMGLRLLNEVVELIARSASALVFTNTRHQAETWYQTLLMRRPDWEGSVALHHGSLEGDARRAVEEGIKTGRLRCVVCTSSLDLGVDFAPVDTVVQIGGPKGVARLLQRAGRSGHSPGKASIVHCVPAYALELVEFAAAREALEGGRMEPRAPVRGALDVLVQHMATVALGGGFEADDFFAEVRAADAYSSLDRAEFDWALRFLTEGGEALAAYPEYRKVELDAESGRYVFRDSRLASLHRMGVGTIVGDGTLKVKYLKGETLGNLEEGTAARLRPGDAFVFAGKVLELVRVQDMTAWVRKSTDRKAMVLAWGGSRMPFSSLLASEVRAKLDEAARGVFVGPEMEALGPLLRLQAEWSAIPRSGELLVETLRSREGFHVFVHALEGHTANEGLAALLSLRLSRRAPRTMSLAVTDYGFELLTDEDLALDEGGFRQILSPEGFEDDMRAAVNAAELAKRHFREVARVAGLVFSGYPSKKKTSFQVQVSASLLYDVFERYDPGNRLLAQARRETIERHLDAGRVERLLLRLRAETVRIVECPRLTPLAFPLWAARVQAHVSSVSFEERARRMIAGLEKAAPPAAGPASGEGAREGNERKRRKGR